MNTHAVFLILLVLTAAAAWAANAGQSAAVLLGLGCAKLLLVAFGFMEIGKAHPVWKCLVVALPAFLLIVSILVLH